MAQLYASIQGNHGERTCTGTASSGIRASAQSWDGSLVIYLDLDDNCKPRFRLYASDRSTGSSYDSEEIFDGTLEELKEKLK